MYRLLIKSYRGRFSYIHLPKQFVEDRFDIVDLLEYLACKVYGRTPREIANFLGLDDPDIQVSIQEWNTDDAPLHWRVRRFVPMNRSFVRLLSQDNGIQNSKS
jgi:hypothetical protein